MISYFVYLFFSKKIFKRMFMKITNMIEKFMIKNSLICGAVR